jgi:hypothetical protein
MVVSAINVEQTPWHEESSRREALGERFEKRRCWI